MSESAVVAVAPTTTSLAPIEAFSRDPSTLFVFSADGVGRPCARGRQPVVYQGAQLRCAIGKFQEGERVHAASVDWLRGTVRLFGSRSDAMNNVPSYCSRGQNELPLLSEPEHADVYVRETFAFLMRGHSILHPQCRCRPTTWQARRVAAMGLDWEAIVAEYPHDHGLLLHSGRMGVSSRVCPAGSVGASRSLAELASELGVRGSMWGAVRVDHNERRDGGGGGGGRGGGGAHKGRSWRMPLLQVLVELAGLTPVRSACGEIVGLTSPICCVPASIESGSDLETAARVLAPRPFVYRPDSHDVIMRRSVWCELQALVRARRVRVVPADVEGAWAIVWNGHALHLEPHGLFGLRGEEEEVAVAGTTPLHLTMTTTTTTTTLRTEEKKEEEESDALRWMRHLWEAQGPKNALQRREEATTTTTHLSLKRRRT
jgi:hypothetical protein